VSGRLPPGTGQAGRPGSGHTPRWFGRRRVSWFGWLAVLLGGSAPLLPAANGRARTREPPAGHVALRSAPPQTVELTLPFAGIWGVLQGMNSEDTHVGYASYALDFVPAERLGGRPVVRRRLEDYPCFGRDILAAAPGRVVWAEDGAEDDLEDAAAEEHASTEDGTRRRVVKRAPGSGRAAGALGGAGPDPGTRGKSARELRARRDPGNFVIVEHAPTELTEYRHLQRGSVAVTVGIQVRRGQVLGRCGSSGNAGTPHLHLGFLGSVDPIATRPMRLSRYEVLRKDGAWTPGDGLPAAGVILRATTPVAEPAAAPPSR